MLSESFITESNPTIAKFMGWTEKLHGLFINESDEYKDYAYHMKPKTFYLEFHKSWDWLMPVGKKNN